MNGLLIVVFLALFFIVGCQEGYVGSNVGNNCPSIEYCNQYGYEDNRCSMCYDLITFEGYDDWAFVNKGTYAKEAGQVVTVDRPAFTDEEAQARFMERSDAQSGKYEEMQDYIVSAPQDNTYVESSGVVKTRESQEDFCKRVKKARYELENSGITRDQAEAYRELVSEFLYQSITPEFYDKKYFSLISNLFSDRKRATDASEDAWRFYLGLPQQHATFGISEYKPSLSTEDKYYYKLNDYLDYAREDIKGLREFTDEQLTGLSFSQGYTSEEMAQILKMIRENNAIGFFVIMADKYPIIRGGDSGNVLYDVLYNYKITKGVDEKGHYLSYYDIWNLEGESWGIEGEKGLLGKPFEIYDRIYYDPETFKILDPQPGQETSLESCN